MDVKNGASENNGSELQIFFVSGQNGREAEELNGEVNASRIKLRPKAHLRLKLPSITIRLRPLGLKLTEVLRPSQHNPTLRIGALTRSITMAPTPESEAFLAKKPTVPASFDGVDYDDTARLKQAQDAIIREQWVRSMMARLVRDELGKCYYREGVNHLEKCGALRG